MKTLQATLSRLEKDWAVGSRPRFFSSPFEKYLGERGVRFRLEDESLELEVFQVFELVVVLHVVGQEVLFEEGRDGLFVEEAEQRALEALLRHGVRGVGGQLDDAEQHLDTVYRLRDQARRLFQGLGQETLPC